MEDKERDDVCHPCTGHNACHAGKIVMNAIYPQILDQSPGNEGPRAQKQGHENRSEQARIDH